MEVLDHTNAQAEENTDFKVLPDFYKKNGYDFKLVKREGNIAIYSQGDDEGRVFAYEVFEVRKQKETQFGDIHYEAKERVPSNEEWGTNAFTVHSMEQAEKYVKQIQETITNRQQPLP